MFATRLSKRVHRSFSSSVTSAHALRPLSILRRGLLAEWSQQARACAQQQHNSHYISQIKCGTQSFAHGDSLGRLISTICGPTSPTCRFHHSVVRRRSKWPYCPNKTPPLGQKRRNFSWRALIHLQSAISPKQWSAFFGAARLLRPELCFCSVFLRPRLELRRKGIHASWHKRGQMQGGAELLCALGKAGACRGHSTTAYRSLDDKA